MARTSKVVGVSASAKLHLLRINRDVRRGPFDRRCSTVWEVSGSDDRPQANSRDEIYHPFLVSVERPHSAEQFWRFLAQRKPAGIDVNSFHGGPGGDCLAARPVVNERQRHTELFGHVIHQPGKAVAEIPQDDTKSFTTS